MNIHIISTSFNSNKFTLNNINSVFQQTFKPTSHVYIDDMSTDNSVKIIENIANSFDFTTINKSYLLKFIVNTSKKYKIKNLFDQIIDNDLYEDDDIICVLDGDDWFSNIKVLEEVYNAYKEKDLDYLYTNWMYSHNNQLGISKKILSDDWNAYESPWITSALSTFRVRKFRQINESNFKDNENNWFTMGCDQAYVLPILELTKKENNGYSKVFYIDKPYYVYQFVENNSKPRNDSFGYKMATDAHNAVTLIRKRGLIV